MCVWGAGGVGLGVREDVSREVKFFFFFFFFGGGGGQVGGVGGSGWMLTKN